MDDNQAQHFARLQDAMSAKTPEEIARRHHEAMAAMQNVGMRTTPGMGNALRGSIPNVGHFIQQPQKLTIWQRLKRWARGA